MDEQQKEQVVTKRYTVYAYKHWWPEHLNDPNTRDIPMPYMKDQREYIIVAESEPEAIAKAEEEYGSGQRIDATGGYVKHPDGSWTIMGVRKVEIV